MGIVHCPEFNFSIHTPPKCGSWACDHLASMPQFADHLVIDHSLDWRARKRRILVLRNHPARVLSVYYDKIVCPHPIPSKYGDHWRELGDDPSAARYNPGTFDYFQKFLMTLGFNAWDSHLQPYSQQEIIWIAEADSLNPYNERCHGTQLAVVYTHEIRDFLLPMVNDCMKRSHSIGLEDFQNYRSHHKIQYADSLPPPTKYGAKTWSEVHYEGLYQCYQDNNALPAPHLVYDDLCQEIIMGQLGYMRDYARYDRESHGGAKHPDMKPHNLMAVYDSNGMIHHSKAFRIKNSPPQSVDSFKEF